MTEIPLGDAKPKKKIMSLPNIKLIHHNFDFHVILKTGQKKYKMCTKTFILQKNLTKKISLIFCEKSLKIKLEGMARYVGQLLAPAESFSLRPRHFLPFGQKKGLL